MRLEVINDIEIVFRDWNDEFDHCKLILKKGLIINVPQGEEEKYDYPFTLDKRDGQYYFITFIPCEYDRNMAWVEIIQESEWDSNEPEELEETPCSININENDVKEVK